MFMSKLGITLIQAHPESLGGRILFGAGSAHSEILSKQRYQPLGVLYLASALSQAGFESTVIDARYFGNPARAIAGRLRKFERNLVGVSFTSADIKGAFALVRFIRTIAPKAVIVVGGPHITSAPAAARFMGADFGVRGDGERAIVTLARAVADGGEPTADGLFRADEEKAAETPAAVENDLDSLPFPDILKVPPDDYSFPLFVGRSATIIASRGCPYNCIFCGIPHRGEFRGRSAENVVEELKLRIKQGFGYIDFKDDCFSIDLQRAKGICEMIISANVKIEWGCETRIDRLDEEFIELAYRAGCKNIKFGIESGVERVQKIIGKRLKLDRAPEMIEKLKRRGITTIAYFLFGHPDESYSEMEDTVKFALKLGSDIANFTLAVPIPGTSLFERAVSEGKIGANVCEEIARGAAIPVYSPDGVTLDEMKRLRAKAYLRFYLRPTLIARQIKLNSGSLKSLAKTSKLGVELILRNLNTTLR
ncbi:MAG: radical SAM protein [Myxococcota bacterium]